MEHSPPQGWYPDPSRRGRQRLWDGTRWTDQVRPVPGERVRPRWLVPLIAVGVVLVVAGASLATYGLIRQPGIAAPSSPASAVPTPGRGVDPAATAAPATGPGAAPGPGVRCAVGEPDYRSSHPEDGRLHGGGLAMPTPDGWSGGDPAALTYAFDVGLIAAPDDAGWAALGAVRIDDPYSTPEQASATITACLGERADRGSLRVTHSGAMAVQGANRAHEYVGVLQRGERTQEFRVIVADLHSPESLAIYVRLVSPDSPAHAAVITAEQNLAGA